MRNTYSNPTINVEKFDLENIVTTSVVVMTANEKAAAALTDQYKVAETNILTLE